MLHVLDGDATLPAFREAGIDGDVVVWREACMEGPWPRALRGVDDAIARAREAASRGEEVVAWFDTDLFCRLNAACFVSLVPHARWTNALGNHLHRDDMRGLFERRAPIEPGLADVWRAVEASDPRSLLPLLPEHPWLKLHLGRFPSTKNGLDIVEQRFLSQLRHDGPSTPRNIFIRMRLGSTFAPDSFGLTFEEVEQRMRDLGPLVERGQPHLQDHPEVEDWRSYVDISPLGRQVLDGERDRCAEVPLDRWVGGAHLVGTEPAWRWDGSTLVERG